MMCCFYSDRADDLPVMLKALRLEKSEGVNSSLVFGEIDADYSIDQSGTSTF